MAVSVFGNCLVVSVYKPKYKKRTSCYFIMVLAIVDLSSSLCIPFVIFDLANPYIHPVPIVCKINRFLEVFSSTSSGMVLVCIAFDRYFHVCHPLRIYSLNQAQSLTIVMIVLAACVSWPILFLAGTKTAPTPLSGVFGDDCSYRDGIAHSIYLVLFQCALFLTFSLTFCIALAFYSKIFYVICKRKRMTIGETCNTIKDETSVNESIRNTGNVTSNIQNRLVFVLDDKATLNKNADDRNPNETVKSKHSVFIESDNNAASITNNIQDNVNSKNLSNSKIMDVCKRTLVQTPSNNASIVRHNNHTTNSIAVSNPETSRKSRSESMSIKSITSIKKPCRVVRPQIRTTRTTIVLGMITVSTLIGFLPYLTVSLMMTFTGFFQPGMSSAEDLTYEFCCKSYFLNAAVNPVIYSVMNPVFRQESVALLKKLPRIFLKKQPF